MPFINGRYHMNPAMGQALEDARSAAEELLASEDASHSLPDDDSTDRSESADAKGPIHHVEIEAAEVLPSSTGRATHGFVARVHRAPALGGRSFSSDITTGRAASSSLPQAVAQTGPSGRRLVEPGESVSSQRQFASAHPSPTRPETHVFTNHRDLLDFLRAELAHDCSGA